MKDFLEEFLNNAPEVKETNDENSIQAQCATNLILFAQTYFPEVFTSEFCEFHLEVFHNIENYILKKKDRKNYYCRAAPRGHGKSQIISFLVPIWCIVYGYTKNTLIVSDSNEQAKQFIQAIKTELEDNEKLIKDFGDFTPPTGSTNPWSQDKIITNNNIMIVGRGAGQKLRGIKNPKNNARPDIIIVDDLENDESVETVAQRNKLKNWFLKALLPCGTPHTTYIYIGTILHYEALLNLILTDPKFSVWDRKVYQAVIKFSRSHLWDKWESILTDLTREKPDEDAYAFYQKNKENMLDGVVSLWPQREEDYYYALMLLRVMDESSFNSEYQNSPIDPERADFKPEWLERNYYDTLPDIVEIFIACDPSMGKSNRSDCSAIVAIGRGTDNYLYVLEADIKRRSPDRIMDDVIYYAVTYLDKLSKFRIETQVFQQFFCDELKKRTLAAGIYVPWDEVKQTQDKELRIRSLIPKVKNGYIKFRRDQQNLINELKRFPKGRDDGADALEMAVSAATRIGSGFCFGKISYRGR